MSDVDFYSWLGDDGNYSGLARAQKLAGGGTEWSFVLEGVGWTRRQELFGLLLAGDLYFTKIDEATARGLAARYHVDADAETKWRWDEKNDRAVSLADGTPAPLTSAATPDDDGADVAAAIEAAPNLTEVPVEERVWPLSSSELSGVKRSLGR